MTISAQSPVFTEYRGDGQQRIWPINFSYLSPQDLQVSISFKDGAISTLEYGRDYAVTPVAGHNGGTLVSSLPTPEGGILQIQLVPVISQEMDLRNNGILDAEALESALDKLTLILKTFQRRLAGLERPEASTPDLSTFRPQITGNIRLYVRVSGDDSNDGLAENAARAKRTLAGALCALCGYDLNGYSVLIDIGEGSFESCKVLSYDFNRCLLSFVGAGIGKTVISGEMVSYVNQSVFRQMSLESLKGDLRACLQVGDVEFYGNAFDTGADENDGMGEGIGIDPDQDTGPDTVADAGEGTGEDTGESVDADADADASAGAALSADRGAYVELVGSISLSGKRQRFFQADNGGIIYTNSYAITFQEGARATEYGFVALRGGQVALCVSEFIGNFTGTAYYLSQGGQISGDETNADLTAIPASLSGEVDEVAGALAAFKRTPHTHDVADIVSGEFLGMPKILASVSANGTVKYSLGLASAKKTTTGVYAIVFEQEAPHVNYMVMINASARNSTYHTTAYPLSKTVTGFTVNTFYHNTGASTAYDVDFDFVIYW